MINVRIVILGHLSDKYIRYQPYWEARAFILADQNIALYNIFGYQTSWWISKSWRLG